MSDDTHRQFESLSRQVASARKKVEQTYYAWTSAAHELKLLERQQHDLWGKLLVRSVTERLPEARKTL